MIAANPNLGRNLMPKSQIPHPLGRRARILLTSVFGPYAQDDEYGSRRINPMELYQNQVTRIQGGFSLRMFHPSFALRMLQANIDAPAPSLITRRSKTSPGRSGTTNTTSWGSAPSCPTRAR